MQIKTSCFSLIITILFIFQNRANAQTEKSSEIFPKVALERTEIRSLHSDIVLQDYEIMISLPKSYSVRDTAYPVIFLLDSYRSFLIIRGITEVFTTPYTIIPEVIIVGIGYGGEGPQALLKWVVGRNRDLSPVIDSGTEEFFENSIAKMGYEGIDFRTGGAPLFLDFLREELFPFIESNYRVDTSQRILSGHSLGGLFGLYALYHNPELFSKYLIGSPSIGYHGGITYDFEMGYANTHPDLKAHVFMSCGEFEHETSADIKKMSALLRSRNYKNLYLETVIFQGESHVTSYPATISRGLFELFNDDQ